MHFVESLPLGPDVEVRPGGSRRIALGSRLPLPSAAREAFVPQWQRWMSGSQATLREVLIRSAGRLGERAEVHTHTPVGDPARLLLEMAALADLLIVGSRGLGAVRRLLLGSVSEKVLQARPVLGADRQGPWRLGDMTAASPGYPFELERDVILRDGEKVHIRPIRPGDAPRLMAAYDRLSAHSAYQRFFSAMRRLPPDWARFHATVDYQTRLALIAERLGAGDAELLGVARYEPTR